MPIDPSSFHRQNVADTCAIWNVLSSKTLYYASCSAGCSFCCTRFVNYECLHKPRKNVSSADEELQRRLQEEQALGNFAPYNLDVQDLQEIAIIEKRMRLSKGELSSIAFAQKTRQAFLTDDQKARKLASGIIEPAMVQTTPHLFGWLHFHWHLTDGDKDAVIAEHESLKRPLAGQFECMYQEALRYRLMAGSGGP